MAADPETGLTLLKIPPNTARPAVPAQRTPTPGLPVLVIGNPFGLGHSVSRGAIAGLNRQLEIGPYRLGGLIQVDASLHPGDSGALLIDLRGGWLGVIRSGLAPPAGTEGDDREPGRRLPRDHDRDRDHDLGFAIPAGDALWVADQLRRSTVSSARRISGSFPTRAAPPPRLARSRRAWRSSRCCPTPRPTTPG